MFLIISEIYLFLFRTHVKKMKSTIEIISILKRLKKDSAYKYGIKPFGVFGSFAWNQQDEASDLDVFVTLQKSDFLLWKR